MTQTQAVLLKADGSWQMEWMSANERVDAILLFGTAMIPTPYADRLPFWVVAEKLASIPANRKVQFVDGTR